LVTKTIGGLPDAEAAANANLFEVEQGGISRKMALAALVAFVLPNGLPDVAPLQAAIDDNTTAIVQLVDTYGTTVTATASAVAAEEARLAAVVAKGQAEQIVQDTWQIKIDAVDARNAAQAAWTAAAGAQTAAEEAANLASSHASAAGGSASAAAGSADIATAQATAAGNSATSASGHANTAEAARDDAETASSAAAISSSAAAAYSSDAEEAASAASDAKVLAESARDTASGHATAAGSSSTLAATKADDASNSAIAASDAKLLAESARDTASGHASAAAGSSSLATTKADAASASATAANDAKLLAQSARDTASGHASAALSSSNLATTKADDASTSATAANDAKLLAQSARDTASGHASAALSSSNLATTKADAASNSATAASDAKLLAESARDTASGYASAASSSATLASTKSDEAGNHATAASDAKILAQAANTTASGHAAASAASAVTSSGYASAAQSSAVLAASVGRNSVNVNPRFTDFPTASGAAPTRWAETYATGTAGSTRVSNPSGGYGWRLPGTAAGHNYGAQIMPANSLLANSYVVIEAEAMLDVGTFAGAGFGFYWNANVWYPFSTTPDSTGAAPGAGTVGKTYRWAVLYKTPNAALGLGGPILQPVSHLDQLGSVAVANAIVWYMLSVRAATDAEIAAGVALPALSATVTTHASAIVTLQGRTTAHWATVVNAGSGATAFIAARAETSPGVVSSSVSIGAQEFHVLYNAAGTWQKALSVSGPDVVIAGTLTTGATIYVGAGLKWPVALQSRDFMVTDGQAVSFGFNLGNTPLFDFKRDNLAPLGTAEVYKVYADAASGTGFTARLRIITPGTNTAYSLTVDTTPGSGPTRQIDKAANPDATNNTYTLRFQGTYTQTAIYDPVYTGGGGGGYGGGGGVRP